MKGADGNRTGHSAIGGGGCRGWLNSLSLKAFKGKGGLSVRQATAPGGQGWRRRQWDRTSQSVTVTDWDKVSHWAGHPAILAK